MSFIGKTNRAKYVFKKLQHFGRYLIFITFDIQRKMLWFYNILRCYNIFRGDKAPFETFMPYLQVIFGTCTSLKKARPCQFRHYLFWRYFLVLLFCAILSHVIQNAVWNAYYDSYSKTRNSSYCDEAIVSFVEICHTAVFFDYRAVPSCQLYMYGICQSSIY